MEGAALWEGRGERQSEDVSFLFKKGTGAESGGTLSYSGMKGES